MARKRTATLLYSTEEVLTVLEFFAVGDLSTAVLLRAVKGGVNLPQTNISAIFKVHLSLFLIAQFFITQLTLPQNALTCFFSPLACCPPVSYTHLDVYKRQGCRHVPGTCTADFELLK